MCHGSWWRVSSELKHGFRIFFFHWGASKQDDHFHQHWLKGRLPTFLCDWTKKNVLNKTFLQSILCQYMTRNTQKENIIIVSTNTFITQTHHEILNIHFFFLHLRPLGVHKLQVLYTEMWNYLIGIGHEKQAISARKNPYRVSLISLICTKTWCVKTISCGFMGSFPFIAPGTPPWRCMCDVVVVCPPHGFIPHRYDVLHL